MTASEANVPANPWRRRLFPVIGGFVAGAVVGAFVVAASMGADQDVAGSKRAASAPTSTEVTTVTVTAPAPTPVSVAPTGPDRTFGDGIFAVGDDVAAGTYSTSGPRGDVGMCSYTFLPRKGAQLTEASGGNTLFGPGYMDLAAGQIVQTLGCTWTLQ